MSQDNELAIAGESESWVERLRSGSRLRDMEHRRQVTESTERALAEHADVLQRLASYDADDDPADPSVIDLYHRTTTADAAAIMASGRMFSKENTGDAFFSNRPDGQVSGYGAAVVHVRVPAALAELDDEFPDGELHFRVSVSALRAEHFIHDAPDDTSELDV